MEEKEEPTNTELRLTEPVPDHIFHDQLLIEISQLIEDSKRHVAREFNSTLVLLNWMIGSRINQAILGNTRAGYGEQIINRLAGPVLRNVG